LDLAIVALHATLFCFLDEKKYEAKTKHWIYFHEIIGLPAHLASLEAGALPSPAFVNMQGFEALNSIVTRFGEDLTRGLSSIGIPNGHQKAVREFHAVPLLLLMLSRRILRNW
jgi:hypothetical protein